MLKALAFLYGEPTGKHDCLSQAQRCVYIRAVCGNSKPSPHYRLESLDGNDETPSESSGYNEGTQYSTYAANMLWARLLEVGQSVLTKFLRLSLHCPSVRNPLGTYTVIKLYH